MKRRRTHILQSAKYLEKKRKKFILSIFLAFLCITSFVVLAVFLIKTPALQISSVNVSNVKTLDGEEIKKNVFEAMEGKYFNLIPKTSIFFFPKKDIENILLSTYKKIDNLSIERENLGSVNISITESQPEAIVCEGFKEEEEENKCFFVDQKGYVFEKAEEVSSGVYTRYYTNHTTTSLGIGETFMDTPRFIELQKFMKSISGAGIPVIGILVGDPHNYELYVRNTDQSTMVVYFDDRTAFEKTSSNFRAFWQSVIAAPPIFDYINLRFGNNVFYTTR